MKKLLSLSAASIGLVMICVAFLGGSTGFAQATNGTIAGSVVDAAGAVVVGATVTATSLETGDKRSATTNKVGAYRIESLLPGNYRVEVTADTFAKTTVDKTVVNASVITSVNVTLRPGSASTSVEVSADTVAALKTDSGELSDTLSAREVNDLPISSSESVSLGITLPGVTDGDGRQLHKRLRVFGERQSSARQ